MLQAEEGIVSMSGPNSTAMDVELVRKMSVDLNKKGRIRASSVPSDFDLITNQISIKSREPGSGLDSQDEPAPVNVTKPAKSSTTTTVD